MQEKVEVLDHTENTYYLYCRVFGLSSYGGRMGFEDVSQTLSSVVSDESLDQ